MSLFFGFNQLSLWREEFRNLHFSSSFTPTMQNLPSLPYAFTAINPSHSKPTKTSLYSTDTLMKDRELKTRQEMPSTDSQPSWDNKTSFRSFYFQDQTTDQLTDSTSKSETESDVSISKFRTQRGNLPSKTSSSTFEIRRIPRVLRRLCLRVRPPWRPKPSFLRTRVRSRRDSSPRVWRIPFRCPQEKTEITPLLPILLRKQETPPGMINISPPQIHPLLFTI